MLRANTEAAVNAVLSLAMCAKQSVIRFAIDILTAVINEHEALDMIRMVCKDVLLVPKQLKALLKVVMGPGACIRSLCCRW